ncbi:MAG TPA: peptide ABC transporter permease [Firmicutes bacterium]|jgi:peptide/nickel transport system permease protein|nr:peptide ABC transporter permease [Bacillota bacterium]
MSEVNAVINQETPRTDLQEELANASVSLWKDVVRRFFHHKLAVIGLVVLIIIALSAIFAPFVAPHDPAFIDEYNRFAIPNAEHIMGTDELGRDVFSRLVYGGRISLSVAALATLVTVFVGTFLGSLAGYYGGWVDNIIMRLADVFFTLPLLFFVLILAILMGPGMRTIILSIGLLSWMTPARLIRGSLLSLRKMEFIEAALAIGVKPSRIIMKHMIPNSLAPLIVQGTLDVANVILIESSLSFLGYGIQPPASSWGTMLSGAQNYMLNAWWLAFWPGMMILITVLAVNFIGDGLRDALDPKLKQ